MIEYKVHHRHADANTTEGWIVEQHSGGDITSIVVVSDRATAMAIIYALRWAYEQGQGEKYAQIMKVLENLA